ncbi:MAG: Uma2 family endonuclease [Myxococcaceae bacterium]|nr:Uma2 family endonuclease [Myxococcaceae bacterium]
MKNPFTSYPDYLAQERASAHKHEYLRGDVWAMAGGTPEPGRLAMSMGAVLRAALKGKPCVVYSSDVRVRIEATDRSTYPDASVVCGPEQHASDDAEAITNPVVLIEVLSPNTERSDRGEKFAHYQRLSSLQEYVLVSQEAPRVEVFRRQGESWLLTIHERGASVTLPSIGATFTVDEVYFDPRTASPSPT